MSSPVAIPHPPVRRRPRANGARPAPLLELDQELGARLSADRRAASAGRLVVAVHELHEGPLDLARLRAASPDHLGLLLLEGVLAREVVLGDTVSTELLGPGDVLRPWALEESMVLLDAEARWSALSEVRVALLDRRLSVELCSYPELYVAIMDRLTQRASRLATTQAISQMTRVDRRLVALCWHLAERWGRVTPDGMHIPLRLSHRLLGQLVGARRPTISAALGKLAETGELVRRPDSTWLLRGDPVTTAPRRLVAPRLKLLPPIQLRSDLA